MAKDGAEHEELRAIGEILKKHGAQVSKETDGAKESGPPKVEKDSFEQRARVKDLSQDQGKQPEGVHQEMGWAARIIAERDKAAEQGRGRGGSSNEAKPQGTAKSTDKAAEPKHSEPTTWAERVIASRPQGYGHGKVEGTEQEKEKAAGKEQGHKAKGKIPRGKPSPKAKVRGRANRPTTSKSDECERHERGA